MDSLEASSWGPRGALGGGSGREALQVVVKSMSQTAWVQILSPLLTSSVASGK